MSINKPILQYYNIFRDVFSVLQNPPVFAILNELLLKKVREIQPPVQCIVGLDARGFLFGPLIALDLEIPFVPIRKRGKLPGKVISYKYGLEYGEVTNILQIFFNHSINLFEIKMNLLLISRTLLKYKKTRLNQEIKCY